MVSFGMPNVQEAFIRLPTLPFGLGKVWASLANILPVNANSDTSLRISTLILQYKGVRRRKCKCKLVQICAEIFRVIYKRFFTTCMRKKLPSLQERKLTDFCLFAQPIVVQCCHLPVRCITSRETRNYPTWLWKV